MAAIQDKDKNENFSTAGIGNASNPSPQDESREAGGNQLLGEQAEKYLRESGNIEDMPDEQDWEEAGGILKKESGDGQATGQ